MKVGLIMERVTDMLCRWTDAGMPFQVWQPFPKDAIVYVKNAYGDWRIDIAKNLWWGYESELGETCDSVIVYAKRLDKPKRFTGAPI